MRRGATVVCAAALAGALTGALAVAALAEGPPARREPSIGYVYPAGGRQGTVLRVTAGGQNLGAVNEVVVNAGGTSAAGVSARVVRYEGAVAQLNGDQRRELKRRIEEVRAKRRAEAAGTQAPTPPASMPGGGTGGGTGGARKADPSELPPHPLLRVLDTLTLAELDRVEARFLRFDPRRQPNAQIAETVLLEVSIDADAVPGPRELRLLTRIGLSNPLRFEVGTLPEVQEVELPGEEKPVPAPQDTPVLLNGQVLPGDADRWRIRARKGERLAIDVHARRLVPYLADAVPGWFQAAVSLRDEKGVELAHADHWRFDPDPLLLVEIPGDGEYRLEIHDTLWRGREDFVYRVSIDSEPDRPPPPRAPGSDTTTGPAIPERDEAEPNDDADGAQPLTLPQVVAGRIGSPGDVDCFRFEGRAGDAVVAEVVARRDGSPLDSLLRLLDASGRVLAWNDDRDDPESGLLTHHADSYLSTLLPADGVYVVRVSDAQAHGGEEYAYRLRVSPPRPDFAVIAAPSALNVPSGRPLPFTVRAVRKDGFAGDIDLALADAPAGFALSGARIPAGRDAVRVTLAVPAAARAAPVAVRLVARARIAGREVVRDAVPAQDMMQAFAYRHLVPAEDLLVQVLGQGGAPVALALPEGGRVRIPAGGSARVRVTAPRRAQRVDFELELNEPPPGITLGAVTPVQGGYDVEIKAAAGAPPAGYADNLIVEAYPAAPPAAAGADPARPGRPARPARRYSLGWLPAIPFEIVPK